ncbi:Cytochrome P450 [Corchorus olitorius]|uniref:Cytochrome P450 n=1 Tax=Corchorus olitorius TaxID=93759 RepID=A0A1R3H3R3_9ROSI|nr:Cytochrome P450 [Corchorus olitorius]
MALPINLPFTRFNRGLKASAKVRTLIKDLISERRAALEQRIAVPSKDLITCLISIGANDPSISMSDEEIIDNVIGVMIAGHDTSSVLITFLVIWAACMTHMDEHIFPDPSKFDPTRFEKQASGAPPYCFVAFGGARICPGNEFARIETLVTIHYLVTMFNWKLCYSDNSFTRNPFPVFIHGMPIQIEPKNSVPPESIRT